MGAACCEVRVGDSEGLSDAGDSSRAARAHGKCCLALDGEFTTFLVEGKELVDATPSPIPRPPGEAPELSWARRRRVSLPWMWSRWEKGEGEVRDEGGEVEPGALPLRGTGGEIGPRTKVEEAEVT